MDYNQSNMERLPMARKSSSGTPKHQKMTRGQIREYVVDRLAAGDTAADIARSLGFSSRTSVAKIAREPDVEARVASLRKRARLEVELGGEPVPESADVVDNPRGLSPEEFAAANLDSCLELSYARLYEIMKYGTFLGRQVDLEKVGVKAMIESLNRAAQAFKAGGGKGKDEAGEGRGGFLDETRLAELERAVGLGGGLGVFIPGQTLPPSVDKVGY